jgi:hypothetical protein
MATLTPEAKQLLSRTIRELRERLLRDLHDHAEGRYRLSLSLEKAKLPEDLRKKRERLEAWLDERVRTANPKDKKAAEAARARFLREAQKEAAATLVNRLVLLRHLEALGLSRPAVVTGGWTSKGYQELRAFAPALCSDETEGYAALLQLVFDELALDLPGLFGDVGLTRLFLIPPATLREVVQRLDDPGLAPAWTDDTTLGWVYQYWNDPEREALDAKLNDGGKIEPHEIASKTQMFTERYMVEWLLQNSLGLTWLCLCRKHGWTPDAERVLPVLDARRAEWRKKREAGEVALDALMPMDGELEEHWKYYVPQPIPDEAVTSAPDSIRTLKLLDPACGSGHFLVIAFDLLAAMYREEARHRGETIPEREIAESILENNLHGIDIDPRAVQIAAAGVVLKAKRLARDARPTRVNLVAPVLRLGNLPEEDPALVRLRRELRSEAGIPEELTAKLVKSLAGVDHLGSLLKVDAAIDDAIREQERAAGQIDAGQGDLLSGRFPAQQAKIDWTAARATVLERLEGFLARHNAEEDLGLRLDGEQLAAGVRFVRMVKEGTYDVVVGNPPYQGTSRMADGAFIAAAYPQAKADLYAVFMSRSLELALPSGLIALVTMRGWMYQEQFEGHRRALLASSDLRSLGDLGTGAFSSRSMDDVISTALVVFRRAVRTKGSVAIQAGPLSDRTRDAGKPARRNAALMCGQGRYEFDVGRLDSIAGTPIVYWWRADFLARYERAEKLSERSRVRKGICTCDDARYVRKWWEVPRDALLLLRASDASEWRLSKNKWLPTVMGSDGLEWFEPLRDVLYWPDSGLQIKVGVEARYGSVSKRVQSEALYMAPGVAFSMIGARFAAREHRFRSVFGNMGSSVFPADRIHALFSMNSSDSRFVLESINPGLHFEVGDVNRLPIFDIPDSSAAYGVIDAAFTVHESARESSVEFECPGPSPWRYAQKWAQRAADRSPGDPLPVFDAEYDPPTEIGFVSFAVGVAFGRFCGDGLGEAPLSTLPDGVLFLSNASSDDSLKHSACEPIHAAWAEHGGAIGEGDDLRTWLRTSFFKHHKAVYENRPIFFPLSSTKKSFVAWISIHRWTSNTLSTLLVDHLVPERRRLEGELDDLRKARANPEKGGKAGAERRFADVQKLLAELNEFIDLVTQCAERGPPPTSPGETPREQDARSELDLDDGVMVNSAALWPLLEPQWKDPKKWWKELATAKGRKDYDWAHLAKRYFPSRVEAKCVEDPSLAVAHGCFWRLHPAKAYAWELRLKDELRPDFTIDETGSDDARARFLAEQPEEARAIEVNEAERRERKARKAGIGDVNLDLDLEGAGAEADGEADADAEPVAEETE